MKKYLNFIIMLTIFIIESLICSLLDYFSIDVLNFMIIYMLGVIICSISMMSITIPFILSIISVLIFNFLYTVPRYSFKIDNPKYVFTIFLFMSVGIIISIIIYKLKEYINKNNSLKIEQIKLENNVEKERIKSTMLKGISHDLRTPLTTIKNGIDYITSDNISDEEKQNLGIKIKQKCDFTITLMNNILNLTRINEENLTVNKKYEVVDDLVSESLRTFELNPKYDNIHVELPDDILTVPVDGILIIQVITNIINNALKFINDDGNILIQVFSTSMHVVFRISNDGPRIKEADLEHIFELYYSTEKTEDSYGLGLAICKLIIDAHKGNISVYNNKERVFFEFSLPLEMEE